MTDEQRAAYLNAMTAGALIEMNAMIALNKEREMLGHSLAYGEEAFMNVINTWGIGHNAAITTLQGD